MRKPRDEQSFREYNHVKKFASSEIILKEYGGNLPKVALIFPNSYTVASGSLAWSWIQQLLSEEGIGVERFFYEPWFEKFYSVEEKRPIDEFPVWLFTFQFENDLINIAQMISKKNIPLKATDRQSHHPAIIIGGPVTLFNHRIAEEIADFIYIGDLECSIKDFSQGLISYIDNKDTSKLTKIQEIYSKKFDKTDFTNFRKCSDALSPAPHACFKTPNSPFPNKVLIEIGRGCKWRCAFCVTGYTKKPVKFVKLEDVIEIMERHKGSEFGLISATITDYPYLDELLDYIEKNNISFSVSSMRVDGLNKKLLALLKKSDRHSFTIAPEGISQRMREIMLKDLSTDEIITGLELGRKVGFDSIKLYYIIGLEEESEEDYHELFQFIKTISAMNYKQIIMSINPLVPKPMTPFSARKIISKKEYEERVKLIKKNVLKDMPRGVITHFESYKQSYMQYEIAHLSGENTLQYLKRYLKQDI